MNINDLKKAVEIGNEWVAMLKTRYPELRAYPVFAKTGQRSGQCALTTDTKFILENFKEMVLGSPAKSAALKLMEEEDAWLQAGKKDKDKENSKKEEQAKVFIIDDSKLEFYGDVLVELRFKVEKIDLDLILQLQADPDVDQFWSEVGSVRVVLGSLAELLS